MKKREPSLSEQIRSLSARIQRRIKSLQRWQGEPGAIFEESLGAGVISSLREEITEMEKKRELLIARKEGGKK